MCCVYLHEPIHNIGKKGGGERVAGWKVLKCQRKVNDKRTILEYIDRYNTRQRKYLICKHKIFMRPCALICI